MSQWEKINGNIRGLAGVHVALVDFETGANVDTTHSIHGGDWEFIEPGTGKYNVLFSGRNTIDSDNIYGIEIVDMSEFEASEQFLNDTPPSGIFAAGAIPIAHVITRLESVANLQWVYTPDATNRHHGFVVRWEHGSSSGQAISATSPSRKIDSEARDFAIQIPSDDYITIKVYAYFNGVSGTNEDSGYQHANWVDSQPTALAALSGWDSNPDYLEGGNAKLHSDGYLELGSAIGDYARIDAAHATYRMWAGHTDPTLATFSVTKEGNIHAVSGDMGAWDLYSGKLVGGNAANEYTGLQSGAGATKAFFAGADDADGTNAKIYMTATGDAYFGGNIILDGVVSVAGYLPLAGGTMDNGAIIRSDYIYARDADGLTLADQSGNLGVFIKDGGEVGIGTVPSYKFSVGSADGSDQIGIFHDNTDAYFRWTDGRLNFLVDEGTNTPSYLTIKGKGTGVGYIEIFDQDNSVHLDLFANNNQGHVVAMGGILHLQSTAKDDVVIFGTLIEGETRQVKIYGHRTGDSFRLLEIGVGVDAADTASFDGVSNYYFDGNIGIGTDSPAERLHIKKEGGAAIIIQDTDTATRDVSINFITLAGTWAIKTAVSATQLIFNHLTPGNLLSLGRDGGGSINLGDGTLYVKKGGNVGIGTTTLRTLLTLKDEGDMGSQSFSAGWTGSGWDLDYISSEYVMEIDSLFVRGALQVYELIINQLHSVNGGQIISPGNGKAASVSGSAPNEVVIMEDPNNSNAASFLGGDLILIQRVDLDSTSVVKRIVRKVDSVSGTSVTMSVAVGAPADSGSIAKGDVIVVIGSVSMSTRRGSIFSSAVETNGPFIRVFDEVNNWAAWKSVAKTRLALGNLAGTYDYASGPSIWGIAAGNDAQMWFSVDPTNGIRILDGSESDRVLFQANGDTLTVGEHFRYISSTQTLTVGGWVTNATSFTGGNATLNKGGILSLGSGTIGYGNANMIYIDGSGAGQFSVGVNFTYTADVLTIGGWLVTSTTIEHLASNIGVKLTADGASSKIQIGDLDEQHIDLNGADGTLKWYKRTGVNTSELVITIDDNIISTIPGINVNGIYMASKGGYILGQLNAGLEGGEVNLFDLTANLFFKVDLFASVGRIRIQNLEAWGIVGTNIHIRDFGGGVTRLYRYTSSARYKENIGAIEIATDRIFDLEVKSYTSKSSDERTFGLIAEEVYKVAPDIVNLDDKDRPDSIREPLLHYMMLAEIQKLRKEVDRLNNR